MADLPTERQFGDYGTWPGRDVLDPDGERLGAVREIYLDRETHQPEWVLVDVNDGDARFVPLADAAIDDASIRVAHRREAVAAAPGIGAEPRIDPEQERRLYAHYGVAYTDEQSNTVLPETDTAPSEYAAATPEPAPGTEEQPAGWTPPAPAATPQATTPGATPAAAIPPPDPVPAAQPEPAVPEPETAAPAPPPAAPAWEATAAPQPEAAPAPPAETAGPPPPAPPSNGATTPQPEPALPPAPEPPRLPPPAPAPHEGPLDKARSRPALVAAILAALALLIIVRRLRD